MGDVGLLVAAPDLGIPEAKPAIESIRGRWVQKVSPKRRHSILQGRLTMELILWAGDSGEVGSEWRFCMLPKGEKPSSLVPDVAYVSFERMLFGLGSFASSRRSLRISPWRSSRRSTTCERCRRRSRSTWRTARVKEPSAERLFRAGERAVCGAFSDLSLDLDALFRGI